MKNILFSLLFSLSAFAQTNWACDFDSALVFEFTTDISIAETNQWSMEFWIQPRWADATQPGYFLHQTANANDRVYTPSAGAVNFRPGAGTRSGQSHLTSAVSVGTWYHVAYVHQGDSVATYVNGTRTARILGTANLLADVMGWYNVSSRYFLNAYIDDFRVWSDARTDAEIAANYNIKLTGNEAGLLYYWTFDKTLESSATANTLTFRWPVGAALNDSNFVAGAFDYPVTEFKKTKYRGFSVRSGYLK